MDLCRIRKYSLDKPLSNPSGNNNKFYKIYRVETGGSRKAQSVGKY
jgi:hypothetical protein